MNYRAPSTTLSGLIPALAAAAALLGIGCEANLSHDDGGDGNGTSGGTAGVAGTAGSAGSSSGAGGDTGTGGTTGTGGSGIGGTGGSGGTTGVNCEGTHVTTAKRLVRLTDNQLANSYTALFGATGAASILADDTPDATNRAFPPLAGTEGTSISANLWSFRDTLGQRAADYVASNFATLTTCGAAPTDAACGQQAVTAFAQKAFRRPLTAEDQTALTALWDALTTDGASVAEAMKYSFYAVLSAPGFLYRTEYGGDWNTDGPLDQYEMASLISYFVMDAPPDDTLLQAAASNLLSDKEEIRRQVDRLLATPAARANLEAALSAYFKFPNVPNIIVQDGTTPGLTVTGGLLQSMYREGELFIQNMLWSGPMNDLLTSRRTWVNSQIAMPLYGVSVPSTDPMIFTEVMLPADRSGLLTLSPFLASTTRPPEGTSVVGRGLQVNAAFVCSQNPAFPEDDTSIADAIAAQDGWTEKQKADYRADPVQGSKCMGCHAQFDAMGLVLENYDSVGRFRTMDLHGNPIDEAWTTSKMFDYFNYDQDGDGTPDQVVVKSPAELAQALIGSGGFERCMAMNFINWALADESQGSARASLTAPHPTASCSVKHVIDNFATTDKAFSSLIREIAASDTLAHRTRGM